MVDAAKKAIDAIHAIPRTVQQGIKCLGAELANGHIQIKARYLADLGKQRTVPAILF